MLLVGCRSRAWAYWATRRRSFRSSRLGGVLVLARRAAPTARGRSAGCGRTRTSRLRAVADVDPCAEQGHELALREVVGDLVEVSSARPVVVIAAPERAGSGSAASERVGAAAPRRGSSARRHRIVSLSAAVEDDDDPLEDLEDRAVAALVHRPLGPARGAAAVPATVRNLPRARIRISASGGTRAAPAWRVGTAGAGPHPHVGSPTPLWVIVNTPPGDFRAANCVRARRVWS